MKKIDISFLPISLSVEKIPYLSPLKKILSPLIALIIGLLIGAILILLAGSNPLVAYRALYQGTFGSLDSFAEVLIKAIPLVIVGMGIAIAFQARFWNIGGEGQILMGAIMATWIGTMELLPAGLMLPLILIGSFVAGYIWGSIAGILKSKFGLNEVIVTIMLNYIAIYFQIYMVRGPLIDKSMPFWPMSEYISSYAFLPRLLSTTRLHAGLFLAIGVIIVAWIILYHLPFGYKIKAIGLNPCAAQYGGINVGRTLILTVGLSGGLAGLVGANEICGVHHRLLDNISAGYGYTAIVVAVLGHLRPLGVLTAGFFFGALIVGADAMKQIAATPAALVLVFQGMILILFLVVDVYFHYRIHIHSKKKERNSFDTG